jgi:hypothetical protein
VTDDDIDNEMYVLHTDYEREREWRQLAEDLYMRLADTQALKIGNVTTLPKLATDNELQLYAARFRALSEAGGFRTADGFRAPARPTKPKRWWWPFS